MGDDILLQQIIDSSNTKKLGALLLMYAKIKGIDPGDISISSIYRAQVRIKYTIKNLTRYNLNANPLEAAEFFQKISNVQVAYHVIDAQGWGIVHALLCAFRLIALGIVQKMGTCDQL